MKILITGSTGLLGQALSRRLARSSDVIGLSRHAPPSPASSRHVICDLGDAQRTAQVVREVGPQVVIHLQACSDVDRCEREPDTARAQNVETTTHLVQALEPIASLLIYLSTDYVFDGTKGAPYDETDAPHPINVYGRSKLEGERVVLTYAHGVVVRTSTLFGPARTNFCDQVVSRLTAGQPVDAFIDQVTSPTYTDDLAEGLADLVDALLRDPSGPWPRVYHLSNAGGCSRVVFAERVADLLRAPRELIRPISLTQQHRPAPRPTNSSLTTTQLPHIIQTRLRAWDDALDAYLSTRHPTT